MQSDTLLTIPSLDIQVLLFIIHKVMDRLSPQTSFLEPYLSNWLMRIKMIGMSTYPQSYFHIELPIKLELVIPPFN
jgi:hypothetical protein